ncbi:TetR/AcrR family transcriptional regulator C-terminal ligand-binding domain-containing protein [Candidatus Saccharibacteria bacterium]|nr:TetR/AcrR family transcriptional regulator C-terminal ligand-binding domain-containing protein [Candidatus Saccharibacteria bacterium]
MRALTKSAQKARAIRETRRRGEVLEDALLQAASEELMTVGYSHLSFKGVAARAHTSRSVLARRWDNRVEMVLAILRKNGSVFADKPADTGSLRGDMLVLLQRYAQRLDDIGIDVALGIMNDCLSGAAASFDLQENMRAANLTHTKIIIARAVKRGEAHANIPESVLALPIELVRAQLMISGKSVDTAYLAELLDNIFLPLAIKEN